MWVRVPAQTVGGPVFIGRIAPTAMLHDPCSFGLRMKIVFRISVVFRVNGFVQTFAAGLSLPFGLAYGIVMRMPPSLALGRWYVKLSSFFVFCVHPNARLVAVVRLGSPKCETVSHHIWASVFARIRMSFSLLLSFLHVLLHHWHALSCSHGLSLFGSALASLFPKKKPCLISFSDG